MEGFLKKMPDRIAGGIQTRNSERAPEKPLNFC